MQVFLSSSYILKANPTELNNCGDIYVCPHADPNTSWTEPEVIALQNFLNNGG